ncbi:hypothetical protein ACHAPV_008055 [Trichoderma viride]
MTTDGISPTDNALRLMRIKDSTESLHVLSYEERSIHRSQAMEKVWPMIEKLDQCTTTADFMTEVETYLTQESVEVLPQHAKRTIRLAAEVVGNKKVLEWIAAAKEDKEKYTWVVTIETPKPLAEISPKLLEDLDVLVQATSSNTQDLLRSRVQVVKMLFESFEQRIREVTSESETHLATNQQLREELSSIRKALEQQPAPKRKTDHHCG